jgi:hypothetical protein
MKEFLQLVIGTEDLPMYCAEWFFAAVGVSISLLMEVRKRDVASVRSPEHFSWNFLFSDNARRIYLSVLLIFVALRFSNDLFGVQISLWLSLLIGLGFDKLAEFAKKKNFMGIGQ